VVDSQRRYGAHGRRRTRTPAGGRRARHCSPSQTIVAEQAGIPIAEASNRISLYARFHDLHLVDVCHGIINSTISLRHYGERRRRPPSPDPPN
jgi:hypothetical protein